MYRLATVGAAAYFTWRPVASVPPAPPHNTIGMLKWLWVAGVVAGSTRLPCTGLPPAHQRFNEIGRRERREGERLPVTCHVTYREIRDGKPNPKQKAAP